MIVKTTSWHYRLQDFFDSPHSDNLCQYFWKTMGALFLLLLAIPLSPFIAIGFGAAYIKEEYPDAWSWRPSNKKSKERGLLMSWLKAKKDKVCPLIEYEYPDKEKITYRI